MLQSLSLFAKYFSRWKVNTSFYMNYSSAMFFLDTFTKTRSKWKVSLGVLVIFILHFFLSILSLFDADFEEHKEVKKAMNLPFFLGYSFLDISIDYFRVRKLKFNNLNGWFITFYLSVELINNINWSYQ